MLAVPAVTGAGFFTAVVDLAAGDANGFAALATGFGAEPGPVCTGLLIGEGLTAGLTADSTLLLGVGVATFAAGVCPVVGAV